MARTALIAGSTGLVGEQLLRQLLRGGAYARVIALVRQPSAMKQAGLQMVVTDFSRIDAIDHAADDAFCCLGTTQAKAGGRAGLERVDYHMVVDFARAAHKAGARRFFVVSSAGTSSRALSFYSRTKARMEAAVSEIGFDTVQIVRPSLLLGARSESRTLEGLAQRVAPLISPLLIGRQKKYRPVPAVEVAEALLTLAADAGARGVHVHHLPL